MVYYYLGKPHEYNFKEEYYHMKQYLNIKNDYEIGLLIDILHSYDLNYAITENEIHILVLPSKVEHLIDSYCKCFNHKWEQEFRNVKYSKIGKKWLHNGVYTRILFNEDYGVKRRVLHCR